MLSGHPLASAFCRAWASSSATLQTFVLPWRRIFPCPPEFSPHGSSVSLGMVLLNVSPHQTSRPGAYPPLLPLIALLPNGGGLFGLALHYQLLFSHHWARTQSYTYLQVKISDFVSPSPVKGFLYSSSFPSPELHSPSSWPVSSRGRHRTLHSAEPRRHSRSEGLSAATAKTLGVPSCGFNTPRKTLHIFLYFPCGCSSLSSIPVPVLSATI